MKTTFAAWWTSHNLEKGPQWTSVTQKWHLLARLEDFYSSIKSLSRKFIKIAHFQESYPVETLNWPFGKKMVRRVPKLTSTNFWCEELSAFGKKGRLEAQRAVKWNVLGFGDFDFAATATTGEWKRIEEKTSRLVPFTLLHQNHHIERFQDQIYQSMNFVKLRKIWSNGWMCPLHSRTHSIWWFQCSKPTIYELLIDQCY